MHWTLTMDTYNMKSITTSLTVETKHMSQILTDSDRNSQTFKNEMNEKHELYKYCYIANKIKVCINPF